jgi:hypothetical protein
MDLYNLACAYSRLSTLGESSASPPTSRAHGDMAVRAMDTLGRALAAGMTDYALMDRDRDLDPLRERPDFRALVLDRSFPSQPFALEMQQERESLPPSTSTEKDSGATR